MKTTMDIPDSVYREFKVKTAMNGETMKSVILAFICAYNLAGRNPLAVPSEANDRGRRASTRTSKNRPSWAGLAKDYITS